MEREEFHLSDQELLQSADGELSTRTRGRVAAHLAACGNCRARLRALEEAGAEFARVRQEILDPQVPPDLLLSGGPRAMLKAQLAATATHAPERSTRWKSWMLAAAALGAIGLSTALYLTIGVGAWQRGVRGAAGESYAGCGGAAQQGTSLLDGARE